MLIESFFYNHLVIVDPAAEHEMQGTALHFASPSAKCDVEMLKTIFNTSERIGKKM